MGQHQQQWCVGLIDALYHIRIYGNHIYRDGASEKTLLKELMVSLTREARNPMNLFRCYSGMIPEQGWNRENHKRLEMTSVNAIISEELLKLGHSILAYIYLSIPRMGW